MGWKYGAIIYVIGLLQYLLATLVFSRQQKYRLVTMVLDLMNEQPEIFQKEDGEVITLEHLVNTREKDLKFGQLTSRSEDYDKLRNGMAHWGLIHLWVYLEAKHARTTTEWIHGMPLLRVAKFGYATQPTPKELAGVLSANTLFTCCIGIWQLAYGAIIIFHLGKLKVELLVPLIVSAFSLLLTVMNLATDCASQLWAIERELHFEEKILRTCEMDYLIQRQRTEQVLYEDLTKIDKSPVENSAKLFEKKLHKVDVMDQYEHIIQAIEEQHTSLLEIECDAHRHRLTNIRGKKSMNSTDTGSLQNEMDLCKKALGVLWSMKKKLEQEVVDKFEELDVCELTHEQLKTRMDEIYAEKLVKVKAIDEQIEKINLQFSDDGKAQF